MEIAKQYQKNGRHVIEFDLRLEERHTLESQTGSLLEETIKLLKALKLGYKTTNIIPLQSCAQLNIGFALPNNLTLEESIEFLTEDKKLVQELTLISSGRVHGIAIGAHVTRPARRKNSTQHEIYETQGRFPAILEECGSMFYMRAYETVLTALLINANLKETRETYQNKEMPISLLPSNDIGVHIYNPTRNRVAISANQFNTYLEGIEKYTQEIIDATALLTRANILRYEGENDSPKVKKVLRQQIEALTKSAETMIATCPKFDVDKLIQLVPYFMTNSFDG